MSSESQGARNGTRGSRTWLWVVGGVALAWVLVVVTGISWLRWHVNQKASEPELAVTRVQVLFLPDVVLELPKAQHTLDLVEAPWIVITPTDVYFKKQRVGSTVELERGQELHRGLYEALQAHRRQWSKVNPGELFPPVVQVAADRRVSFRAVGTALYTAGAARCAEVSFVVEGPEKPARLAVAAIVPGHLGYLKMPQRTLLVSVEGGGVVELRWREADGRLGPPEQVEIGALATRTKEIHAAECKERDLHDENWDWVLLWAPDASMYEVARALDGLSAPQRKHVMWEEVTDVPAFRVAVMRGEMPPDTELADLIPENVEEGDVRVRREMSAFANGCVWPPPRQVVPPAAPVPPPEAPALDPGLLPEATHLRPLSNDDAPVVSVVDGMIQVSGQDVARTSTIDKNGKLTRIAELRDALQELRERWLREHPGEDYHRRITFWIPATSSLLHTKSIFLTAATIDHPNGSFVVRQTGTTNRVGRIEVDTYLPPAELMKRDYYPPTHSLLDLDRSGVRLGWSRSRGDPRPNPATRYLWDISEPKNLRDWVQTEAATGWKELSSDGGEGERLLRLGIRGANDLPLQSLVAVLDGFQGGPLPKTCATLFAPAPPGVGE